MRHGHAHGAAHPHYNVGLMDCSYKSPHSSKSQVGTIEWRVRRNDTRAQALSERRATLGLSGSAVSPCARKASLSTKSPKRPCTSQESWLQS